MILSLFTKLDYYKSIDELPVYNWFKIQETNDLTYLLKVKKECSKRHISKLKKVLNRLTNEYIDCFGISDQHKKVLELQRDIRIKEIELTITGHKINKTHINVLKSKLKAVLSGAKKSEIDSAVVHASKYMGYHLDLKQITVKRFYTILNEIKKEAIASQKK